MRVARKKAGLSQREVADKLRWSLRTYSRYENNHFRLPLNRIPIVADALGTDEDWLRWGVGNQEVEVDSELVSIMNGVHAVRAALNDEWSMGEWKADMDSALHRSGLINRMTESEKELSPAESSPTVFLNVRIDAMKRDELHETAALLGVTIQEAVALSIATLTELLRGGQADEAAP